MDTRIDPVRHGDDHMPWSISVISDRNWRLGVIIDAAAPGEDGLTHSIRIGDQVDNETEDVVPFGAESGAPARITGAGFSTSRFAWAA